MNPRRMTLTLGVAAGGLLAAAFLPMAVGSAVPIVIFVPDDSSFDPMFAQGMPGFFDPTENVTGSENWIEYTTSLILATNPVVAVSGNDNITGVLGTQPGFTAGESAPIQFDPLASTPGNEDLIVTDPLNSGLPFGTQLDFWNMGGGVLNFFEAEPVDVAGLNFGTSTLTDVLITPLGVTDLTPILTLITGLF
jgi:hypothetical protein